MLDGTGQQPDAIQRLKDAGLAYVRFALTRPEHFTVMFDAPVLQGDRREPAEAGQQAFGTLLKCVKRCQDEGRLRSGDTLELALLAWSMVHGIAKLAITGCLPLWVDYRNLQVCRILDRPIFTAACALVRRLQSAPVVVWRTGRAARPARSLTTLGSNPLG